MKKEKPILFELKLCSWPTFRECNWNLHQEQNTLVIFTYIWLVLPMCTFFICLGMIWSACSWKWVFQFDTACTNTSVINLQENLEVKLNHEREFRENWVFLPFTSNIGWGTVVRLTMYVFQQRSSFYFCVAQNY